MASATTMDDVMADQQTDATMAATRHRLHPYRGFLEKRNNVMVVVLFVINRIIFCCGLPCLEKVFYRVSVRKDLPCPYSISSKSKILFTMETINNRPSGLCNIF
mmetsp:Transcript_4836/g.10817  ORF Transcript_4836/g.10817 Transcript_4836/m.10817 type:complete len:104 (+) Transcript_4836:3519-3830(+)